MQIVYSIAVEGLVGMAWIASWYEIGKLNKRWKVRRNERITSSVSGRSGLASVD